jgi:3'(2'),5'-bisphosphate nucleotidase
MPDHGQLALRLVPAVLAAGAALLRHRAAGVSPEVKADGSPVSAADREAEDILVAALEAHASTIPVIAEERVAAGAAPSVSDRAFLVDALDGTREYLSGGDDFTVNIALVERGSPVFGLLLAPALGRLFATVGPARAASATFAPASLPAGQVPPLQDIRTVEPATNALRILTSRSHRSSATEDFLAKFPGASVTGIGSSLKFGLIAAGEADVYPRFGPTSAWDIAAGHAILIAAGGCVTKRDGTPLQYLQRAGDFLNPHFIAWGRPELVRPG